MITEWQQEQWRLWGRSFGYPECCVEFFVRECTAERYGDFKDRKLWGTGYVPCELCNEKSEDELKETIAKGRKTDVPFPKGE